MKPSGLVYLNFEILLIWIENFRFFTLIKKIYKKSSRSYLRLIVHLVFGGIRCMGGRIWWVSVLSLGIDHMTISTVWSGVAVVCIWFGWLLNKFSLKPDKINRVLKVGSNIYLSSWAVFVVGCSFMCWARSVWPEGKDRVSCWLIKTARTWG